jgi:hypothetical protein
MIVRFPGRVSPLAEQTAITKCSLFCQFVHEKNV